MKVPVIIELFRRVEARQLSLDDTLVVTNQFHSIVDGIRTRCRCRTTPTATCTRDRQADDVARAVRGDDYRSRATSPPTC